MADELRDYQEAVRAAAADGRPLCPRGGGSKDFLGTALPGGILDVAGHAGIVDYQPAELVLTARSGTPLAELEATLSRQDQMLGFEPPRFGDAATLGGTLACGLSGPRRPYTGAARDFILGTRIINGRGECLRFGGEVMKNVAGYDISRLMVGSLGTLGLITEASLKVLPRPPLEITLVQACRSGEGLSRLQDLARGPLPVSATLVETERICIRLSGTEAGVAAARRSIGGETLEDEDFWTRLREHRHPFFPGPDALWRLSLPATAETPRLAGDWLLEWGGALRWLKTTDPDAAVVRAATARGGHAVCYRGGGDAAPPPRELDPALLELHRRTKAAFDPAGIFNPRRYYRDF